MKHFEMYQLLFYIFKNYYYFIYELKKDTKKEKG